MPEDTSPEDKIAALVAERDAIRLRPDATERQADIDKQLAELGYEEPADEPADEPAPETPSPAAEPAPAETPVPAEPAPVPTEPTEASPEAG